MSCKRCCHPAIEAIDSNNKGANCLQSGDFQQAIHCFHRALVRSYDFVSTSTTADNISSRPDLLASTQELPTCLNCRAMTPSVSPTNTTLSRYFQIADDNSSLQVYYEPIVLRISDDFFRNTYSTSHEEFGKNLVVAAVILNTAIAYHLHSIVENNSKSSEDRARALYDKALQILTTMDMDVQGAAAVGVECALYDLILLVALNNTLAMMGDTSLDSQSIQYTNYLLMCALACESKRYEESYIATSISKWQHEFLANAMVSRFCSSSVAAAA